MFVERKDTATECRGYSEQVTNHAMYSPDSPYPRRPTRLDRVFAELSPCYFITFITQRRARFLACEPVHAAFVEFCRRAGDLNIAVGRYVLMPDHIHLFVALPEVGNVTLGGWVKSLKVVLGKTLLTLNVDKTALAGRFLRSSAAQCGQQIAKVGLRADEPGARGTLPYAGRLAVSG